MKLLLTIRYDGGAYCGFQAQNNGPTVQNALNAAFYELFKREFNITGCSRTDSGVHALAFRATASPKDECGDGWCPIPDAKFPEAINTKLPYDIAVIEAVRVRDDFHARYDIKSKRYVYLMRDMPARDPFLRGRVYELGKALPDDAVDKMNAAARLFEGTHDFTSFMAAGSKITDATRTVFRASVERRDNGVIAFTAEADGFLYNMVRIMAGTLIAVGRGQISAGDTARIIDAKDRGAAGPTAPPHGLYLEYVDYGDALEAKRL